VAWWTAAVWTVVAVGVGTFRGYTLLATGGASVILALHLLLVVLAAGRSLVGRFPFGPSNQTIDQWLFSAGDLYALWMVPALALGLAALAHPAHRWAATRDQVRLALDAGLVLAAIGIIVAGYEQAREAPFPGSESATRFVDASMGPDDVAIVTGTNFRR
jgi:hypothetical protein